MLLLAFDTAQGALSAALYRGGEEIAAIFEERSRGHAEALMPMVEGLLDGAGLGFDDLNALAVTVGPGTFTGLRVGLSAARGVALARRLPLVGVTTLEAIAEPVSAIEGEKIVSVFDARRNEIYMQVFSHAHAPLTEPLLLSLDDAPSLLSSSPHILVGTGAGLLHERLAGRDDVRLSTARPQPDAAAIARIAVARLDADGVAAFMFPPAPLYIRAPDAKLPGGITPDMVS